MNCGKSEKYVLNDIAFLNRSLNQIVLISHDAYLYDMKYELGNSQIWIYSKSHSRIRWFYWNEVWNLKLSFTFFSTFCSINLSHWLIFARNCLCNKEIILLRHVYSACLLIMCSCFILGTPWSSCKLIDVFSIDSQLLTCVYFSFFYYELSTTGLI